MFQQSESSELMPILSHAIINFEKFMTEWERIGNDHKVLKPWTDVGLRWATKYYIQMDDTEAYILTMCKITH